MLGKMNIIPFVEYELVIEGLRLCSKCRNFVDEDTEFVPASHIYYKKPRKATDTIYAHLMKMCRCYGIKDAEDYVDAMIAADHILGNDDRHLGNFGFIRDVETAGITGFAPLFDSGSSYGVINGKPGTSKLFREMEKEVDVWGTVAKGDLSPVTAWLTDKIHQYGSLRKPQELLPAAMGGPLDAAVYTGYLKKKFGELYRL